MSLGEQDAAERRHLQQKGYGVRGRILLAAGAVAAALIAGIGIGTALFAGDEATADSFPMTERLEQVRAQLESRDDFDAGSVQIVAEQHGVTIWEATQQNGALPCVLLTDAEGAGADFTWGSARCGIEGDPGSWEDVIEVEMSVESGELSVRSSPTATGERATEASLLSGWDREALLRARYDENQREAVDQLTADGFERYRIDLAGEDGALSLWSVTKRRMPCLALSGDGGKPTVVCAESLDQESIRLVPDAGATIYALEMSRWGSPQLVIDRTFAEAP